MTRLRTAAMLALFAGITGCGCFGPYVQVPNHIHYDELDTCYYGRTYRPPVPDHEQACVEIPPGPEPRHPKRRLKPEG